MSYVITFFDKKFIITNYVIDINYKLIYEFKINLNEINKIKNIEITSFKDLCILWVNSITLLFLRYKSVINDGGKLDF